MTVTRRDADFTSNGTRCAAWLYRSENTHNPPVVVMGHGFGCERDWRLPAYAERFAENGMAVLVFDYRYFGDSDGQPRNLVSPKRQVRDWLSAIDHARRLDDVDGNCLGLWGNSFSSGHIITAAAKDGNIDAAILLIPFTDGISTALHFVRAGGLRFLTGSIEAALRDLARKVTFRSPYYVPIAGTSDEVGVLNPPGTLAGYDSISGGEWENKVPARIFLSVLGYRPIRKAGLVDCPALVVEAEEDHIIPTVTVDRLVRRLNDVERVRYPVDHFDIFTGEEFEIVVERNTEFLQRHLLE